MRFEKVTDLVGHTPVVKLNKIVTEDMADVYVKLEGFNLTGSVKVRPALGMIEGAEKRGELSQGMIIIEPTSGNTGIALALIAKMKGYPIKIVMPDTMSVERRNIIKAYGAELVLTDGTKGMSGAIAEATRLAQEEGYYMPQQFKNHDNSQIHYETTALEILEDFQSLDAFVSTVGTGGTITGVGRRLREHFGDMLIAAVEPEESKVLSGEKPGPHKIQGIGAGFVPDILNVAIYDEVMTVTSEEAYAMTHRIFNEEGLFVGISTGAVIAASLRIAKRLGKGKTVLTLSPDSGEKYISNGVFQR